MSCNSFVFRECVFLNRLEIALHKIARYSTSTANAAVLWQVIEIPNIISILQLNEIELGLRGSKYNAECTQYFSPVEHSRRPAGQICGDCSCCDITPRVSCKNLTFSIYLILMTTIMVTMMSMMIFQRLITITCSTKIIMLMKIKRLSTVTGRTTMEALASSH